MKRNKLFTLFTLIVLLFVVTLSFPILSSASEISNEPYITVSSYEITNGKIIPGEPFELTIAFQNTDEQQLVRDVLVTVTSNDGISAVYPSVSQVLIGDIGPETIVTETFKMMAPKTYEEELASFYITINTYTRSNYVIISAPVEIDSSCFNVITASVPDTAEANQVVTPSINFKVSSNDNMSNVLMRVTVDDVLYDESAIGNMRAGATKNQSTSIYIGATGKHYIAIELAGTDSNGIVQTVEAYSGTIFVSEASGTAVVSEEELIGPGLSKKEKITIVGCGFMIIVLLGGIVLVVRKNS